MLGLKKLRPSFLLSLVFLLAGLLPVWPVLAQTGTPPPPRDALIQAIQARAQSDVAMGKSPESVAGLQILFGESAKAIGMPMTEVVSTYEAAYQAARQARSPWQDSIDLLHPSPGWVVAGILLFILVFRDVIKDYLSRFVKWLFEAAYQRLAGYRPFWLFALRRYRAALENQYQELKVLFRPDRPLKMLDVYVPLRVSGSSSRDAVDAYRQIQQHKRLVAVGAPGAGKSIFLRHLALTYARRGLGDFPRQPVPVLLELNRLNYSQEPLLDQLARVLGSYAFPNARGFLQSFLKRGQLLLLLDGLDEVDAAARGRVVQAIQDLLPRSEGYQDNQVIITCRTQVYRDEFADWAERKLEIMDFDDQQIQRFLSAWERDMPQAEGKSAKHLISALRERPQIMALARNPLLLTMIAYLYTDTAFVLPHSRAEFYDRSATLLLEQWKIERNRYKAGQKRLVLQHQALVSGQTSRDRRNIEATAVLAEMLQVLPSLTLKDDDAQPMLDEIVERSGLLIAVDGGARYQFTHLTLQEFLAAEALRDKEDALLANLGNNPEAWREVVRLWCGLEHDSTGLIRKVYVSDPLLAFECLADAQQVEGNCVNELVDAFKARLPEAAEDEPLARAMALVAADPRPRGVDWFDYLCQRLADPQLQRAAAAVLSLTNLPKAAQALAGRAGQEADLRLSLTRMGDLAVPALTGLIGLGQDYALDGLYQIGTPAAALALASLLWKDNPAAYAAAWRLAALLLHFNIETALRPFTLTPEQRKTAQVPWVWEPFNELESSSLPAVAGRIAHLLDTADPDTIPSLDPSPAFDARLAIPICAVLGQKKRIKKLDRELYLELVERLKQPADSSLTAWQKWIAESREKVSDHPVWLYLLAGLPEALQFRLLQRVLDGPVPTPDDWRNVFHPAQYEFARSWQARGVKSLLLLVLGLNLWGVVETLLRSTQLWTWGNAGAALLGILALAGMGLVGLYEFVLDEVFGILFTAMICFWVGIGATIGALSSNWVTGTVVVAMLSATLGAALSAALSAKADAVIVSAEADAVAVAVGAAVVGAVLLTVGAVVSAVVSAVVGAAVGAVGGAVFVAVAAWPTQILYTSSGWTGVALFWGIWLACLFALYTLGMRRDRQSRNPLHGLLDEPGLAPEHPIRRFSFGRWFRWYR